MFIHSNFGNHSYPHQFLRPYDRADGEMILPSFFSNLHQINLKKESISVKQQEINKKKELVINDLFKKQWPDFYSPFYFECLSSEWIIRHEWESIFFGFDFDFYCLFEEEQTNYQQLIEQIKNWSKNLSKKNFLNEMPKGRDLGNSFITYLKKTKENRMYEIQLRCEKYIKKIEFINFYSKYYEYIDFNNTSDAYSFYKKQLDKNDLIDFLFCLRIKLSFEKFYEDVKNLLEIIEPKLKTGESLSELKKKNNFINTHFPSLKKNWDDIKQISFFIPKRISKIIDNLNDLLKTETNGIKNVNSVVLKNDYVFLSEIRNAIKTFGFNLRTDITSLKIQIGTLNNWNQGIQDDNILENLIAGTDKKLLKLVEIKDDKKKKFVSLSEESKIKKIQAIEELLQKTEKIHEFLIKTFCHHLNLAQTSFHVWLEILEEKENKKVDLDWRVVFKHELEEEDKIQQLKAKRLLRKKQKKKINKNFVESDLQINSKAFVESDTQINSSKKKLKNESIENKKNLENNIFTTSLIHKLEEKISKTFQHAKQENLFDKFNQEQVQAASKDVCFHLKNLGCLIDIHKILQSKKCLNESERLKKRIFSSTAIMLEQYLSAKILHNNQIAELSHEHLVLADEIKDKEFEQKIKKHLSLLKAINGGCIIARYPNQISFFNKGKLPEGIWNLLEKKSEKSTELNKLPLEAIAFLDEKKAKKIESLLNQTLNPKCLPKPKNQHDICQRGDQIIKICSQVGELVENIRNQYDQEKTSLTDRKKALCQDIIWHLEGLKDSIEILKKVPQTRFLFSHGHSILTHLQWMIELILKLKLAQKGEMMTKLHDLEELFLLVEEKEDNLKLNVGQENEETNSPNFLEDLNLSYGAHYLYRRLESIRIYNSCLKDKTNSAVIPEGMKWRLRAQELSQEGDAIDMGMNRSDQHKKNQYQTKVNALYQKLFSWCDQTLSFASKCLKNENISLN